MTRAVTITTAGTDYPVGPKEYGGANVDEIELYHIPYSQAVFPTIYVTAISGTNTSLAVTFEIDDTVAFSSPLSILAARAITATGVYQLSGLAGVQELFGRFKIVSTSNTTAAATVTCTLSPNADSRYNQV